MAKVTKATMEKVKMARVTMTGDDNVGVTIAVATMENNIDRSKKPRSINSLFLKVKKAIEASEFCPCNGKGKFSK